VRVVAGDLVPIPGHHMGVCRRGCASWGRSTAGELRFTGIDPPVHARATPHESSTRRGERPHRDSRYEAPMLFLLLLPS
jgi:hypothetical protein